MKFKRNWICIQMIAKAKDKFEFRYGWTSEDGQYGFHKSGKFWVATDIASGMKIIAFPTRIECVEWIKNNSKLISIAKTTPRYLDAIELMREFCNKN